MFAVVNIPNECSILNDLIQNRDLLITSARYLSVGLSGYIFRNRSLNSILIMSKYPARPVQQSPASREKHTSVRRREQYEQGEEYPA